MLANKQIQKKTAGCLLLNIGNICGANRLLTFRVEFISFRYVGYFIKTSKFPNMHYLYVTIVHSCFSGSVKCWAPSMENGFQVNISEFEVQKTLILFCLVQNGKFLF